jgi:two-component system nitrogen regulation sensor histidine kinase GlnL
VELSNADWHQRVLREENLIAQHNVSSALIRGMAHEIKNPLGGLRGAAQLLERELHSDELKEYTRIIIQEADRLRKLLDRMSGPNALPDKKELNIHEILEHVRQLVSAESPENVHIERDYDPSIPSLQADRDQLIQAFLNVIRNARQSIGSKPGTITLRTRTERQFTIGLQRHRLVLRVDVIDDGPGIPAELKESIFYPMVTGREEGTGLGLSIAQSMAHYHDGLIACQSVPGNTCFSIWLPISKGIQHES